MDFKVTTLYEVTDDPTRVTVVLSAHWYVGDDPYRVTATLPLSMNLKIGQVLSFGPEPSPPDIASVSSANEDWAKGWRPSDEVYPSPFYRDSYVNASTTKPVDWPSSPNCTDSGLRPDGIVRSTQVRSKEELDLADEIKRLEDNSVTRQAVYHQWHADQTDKAVDAFVETVTPKKKKRHGR
jgi:hypothetical protein